MQLMVEKKYIEWANALDGIEKIAFKKNVIRLTFDRLVDLEAAYKSALKFRPDANVETHNKTKCLVIAREGDWNE